MAGAQANAVLFAELIGAAELFAHKGDAAAQDAIRRCAELLGNAAASCDTKVVKLTGSRLMLVAGTADAGAAAAAAMQSAADTFPGIVRIDLGLGVGLHFGPVLREKEDIFGDTVNLAARMVEQAARGQIVFASETAAAMSEFYRRSIRRLYSVTVKGRAAEVALCELMWRSGSDGAATLHHVSASQPRRAKCRLKYRGKELELEFSTEPLVIGREADCGIVVANVHASRHHCQIQRRGDHFVLADRSTNGTFVTIQGEDETRLKREEFVLRKRGWISFGSPRGPDDDAVEFFCD